MARTTDASISTTAGALTRPRGASWRDRIFPTANLVFLVLIAATMIVPLMIDW